MIETKFNSVLLAVALTLSFLIKISVHQSIDTQNNSTNNITEANTFTTDKDEQQSTPQSPQSTEKPKGKSLALIIGLSVALILIAIVIIICCICCIKKLKSTKSETNIENDINSEKQSKISGAKHSKAGNDNKSQANGKSPELSITQSESSFTDSIDILNEKKIKRRPTEQDEGSLKSTRSLQSDKGSLASTDTVRSLASTESMSDSDSDYATNSKSK